MHIVLVEPEIPANTGNIVRTCAATSSVLHLVRPLGFSTEDKYLKRAGLDYWYLVEIYYHDSFEALKEKYPLGTFYYVSTKAARHYCDVEYGPGDFLVFGKETRGLPESLLQANSGNCVRIPMVSDARSLNLANSVAIVLYEALRQQAFAGLETAGRVNPQLQGTCTKP
ncbi:RNA methyltransferase, TrmH family, group 2 [Desulfofarcimen acetoxidans DSM 771]|uniref:Putative tRNA (cytidine(34)-2'-O)-methyltransferase n=1 Tax=Desulfofarcimen acetoxidans (strain ATCC 49208 / DSM 771 / KCTC 5769 / VKM B-1644 / 5575) TaxID=485916 RepID=C8W249_DESAS|nr:tRNA (uridine(34)/cytosine(34)/5-carboxymethylaminomethyluridine(34)-2'-O)-methyltransferase TrmL [Desulfofarcimen acetoxidans]ACV61713.1 RNA methyltransferase, TrmH family, group 2 [Desulfofarcimen acetoxidans DSM 771]